MLNDKSYIGLAIGKDAGYSTSKTYVCGNKNCDNHYIMFFTDSDNKVCEVCRKAAERFTEKHLEPRPGELEALRKNMQLKIWG